MLAGLEITGTLQLGRVFFLLKSITVHNNLLTTIHASFHYNQQNFDGNVLLLFLVQFLNALKMIV